MSYALINKMTVQAGKRDAMIEILIESGKAFNDNPACELYLISKDKNNESVIWVQDFWVDSASHKAAMADDGMKQYIQKSMPLLAGMPEQFEIVAIGGKHPFTLH